MSTLYPRLPANAAKERFLEIRESTPKALGATHDTTHLAQYFAPTGGTRATAEGLAVLRDQVVQLATARGFPDAPIGQKVHEFDTELAVTLHQRMDVVAAEAAQRPIWAFLALVVLPDVSVWRFPQPPEDRVLATDITRHVFGRLWWRAELLREPTRADAPYHLLSVFPERNFDQILSRRRSIGGSPELVRALAKEWPSEWPGQNETDALRDVLKHLMRRGAFQDVFGLPEALLRLEVAAVISDVRHGRLRARPHGATGRHSRV